MILSCDNCNIKFNDETAYRCPLCFPRKVRNFTEEEKRDRHLGREIKGFIISDSQSKKKTATGYQHKTKTGSF